ncbi:serine/threonine-protein kinase [Goodfellowiella coeruleoviolacea]|uniref:non-specific serine/threonine protein kinase n=1 Tax=Goodfellowiella coeruleoviolacea TaxID=334858 RepID=A0AAE3GJY4_9PSEU|nr:serine/threonine-protein kinase [Goodfellowiella coeruleoviolacea]MCP2169586.1 Serine/threonine protein kinase [Goodfellowiella coeruleoviolacea]
MAEQHEPVIDQRLIAGRYAVLGEIGRGGMGVVWRAQDRVIGRQVAIKELHVPDSLPAAERQVFRERVLREARSTGRLNDPSVITVHDVVAEGGSTYIVMELVEAPSLAEVVRQRGPLAPDQVVEVATQLLSALEVAHAAGIVHRDVKPGNVMVLPNGRVKLADFGIAQAVDDPRLTTSGAIVGSPAFLAPERIQGSEATPASDMWALGATLFCAVEGHVPFERATTAATLHAIVSEVPRLTRCQGPLASVITGLLIAAPEARLTAPQVRALLAQARHHSSALPAGGATPGGHPGQTVHLTHVGAGLGTLPGGVVPRRRVRALPVTLGVLGALLLVAAGVVVDRWALARSTWPAAMTPTLTWGLDGDIADFRVGQSSYDCAFGQVRQGAAFPDNSGVPCDKPHDVEIFSKGATFGDAGRDDKRTGYPGQERLRGYAEGWCALVYQSDQVGGAAKDTEFAYAALVPTEREWNEEYAHSSEDSVEAPEIYCVLWRTDGAKMEASVRPE